MKLFNNYIIFMHLGWVLGISNVAADDTADNVQVEDDIVVTGVQRDYQTESSAGLKTDTPLIDVPQTVSVITEVQIQDQAIQDIGDITRYTPGITVSQGEAHRDAIVIRGQRTTADFFLDGVRDDVQYYRPLYNLDRVEVHKGPNALIFGRGSGAGNINRVTKTAILNDRFASINSSADTFGAYQFAVDGNTAITDNIAIRINALAEGFDNHRDFFDGERYAFNPTIAAELSNRTRLELSYEYVNDDRVVDRGVPAEAGGTRANPANPVTGFDDTFFGSPSANFFTFEANIIRSRLFHEFNANHSVNATIQYADYDKFYQNLYPIGSDLANNTFRLQGYNDRTDRENFIAQVNFLSNVKTWSFQHELLYGLEYGDQQTDNGRNNALFADSGTNSSNNILFTDPISIPGFSFPTTTRDRDSDATFLSAFLQDQITINQYLQLVGGVRIDRFDIDVVDQIEVADGAADGNSGFLGRTDTEVSPRVGLIVKPIADVSVYASYSQSFLPRSGDQFLTLTPTTESLQPEEFKNYEFGVKWDVTNSLAFTSSIFRLERDSGTTVDPNNPLNTILVSSETEGLELQLVGQLMPSWKINAGYSYLDGREDGRVVGGVSDNRTLREVPEHQFSVWNRYDVTSRLGLGLGVIHQSSQFASNGNTVELPSYTRVDAAGYYTLTNKIRLQVNVENLFDEDYFPNSHNDNNITTGEPLNARFAVLVDF